MFNVDQAEPQRVIFARIVGRMAQYKAPASSRWLDVGCGNGALVGTADEFGFDAVGLDARPDAVKALWYAHAQNLNILYKIFIERVRLIHILPGRKGVLNSSS